MAKKRTTGVKGSKSGGVIRRFFSRHKQLTMIVVIAVIFGTAGAVWYLRSSSAAETDIDTTNQAAVNSAYWNQWVPGFSQYSGWTGSVAGCNPGRISDAGRVAHNRTVNFARRLNKLTPVVGAVSDTTVAGVQKAALMMDANEKLSHTPDRTWKCYTVAGDEAAGKSNLYLSAVKVPVGNVIKGYMDDNGASNTAVGHRRWLLNPDSAAFAYGMTNRASALQVVGLPTDTDNKNPSWVSWPSPHWFPSTIVPFRWSLSSGHNDAIFKYATVKVTRNGVSVPITKHAVHSGYGKPTLVWNLPSGFDKTGTYTVRVENIKRSSTNTTYSYIYSVKLFEPVKPA